MTTMWVKRRSGPVFCAVLWVICQCMPGAATEAHASPLDSLGILPDKAVASLQVTNLVTEICQDRAFSIDFPAELPSGYRFIQLRDKTATPWIGEMVRQRPQFESYAWGSFCVCEGRFAVNGTSVTGNRLAKFPSTSITRASRLSHSGAAAVRFLDRHETSPPLIDPPVWAMPEIGAR